jgi:cytidylate kinase
MAILTISREIGTEGLAIGQRIAEELGYEIFDRARALRELRAEGPRWAEVIDKLDGHAPSVWHKYDWHYMGYVALAQSHVLDCALSGKAVIVGRGANFLLENVPYVLRARLIAPMEVRLRKVTQDDGCSDFVCISTEASRELLDKVDQESENLVKSVFGREGSDQKAYDIILNMEGVGVDEAAETLKTLLVRREAYRDSQAENQLRKRALAAKVKAAIFTNPAFSVPTFEVLVTGEEIVLKGVVHNAKEHKLIEEEARKITGNVSIRCELRYR